MSLAEVVPPGRAVLEMELDSLSAALTSSGTGAPVTTCLPGLPAAFLMPLPSARVSPLPAAVWVWVFLYSSLDSLLGGKSFLSLKKEEMGLFPHELKAKAGWLPLPL